MEDGSNSDIRIDTVALKPGINVFGVIIPYDNSDPMGHFICKLISAVSNNADIDDTSIIEGSHYLETSGNVVDSIELSISKAKRYDKKNVIVMFAIDKSVQSLEDMWRIKHRITTEYASAARQNRNLKIYITFTTDNKDLIEESDNDVIDTSLLSNHINIELV